MLRDKKIDFGPKPFRVFDVWLDDVEVENIVKASCETPVKSNRPDCIFRDKLKNVKNALKHWSKQKFRTMELEIEESRKEAMEWEAKAECRKLNETELNTWLEARCKWLEKDMQKATIPKQKARIKWDIEGNKNTKFFHSMIKTRNNKNNIRGLLVNGVWNEELKKSKTRCCDIFSESSKIIV